MKQWEQIQWLGSVGLALGACLCVRADVSGRVRADWTTTLDRQKPNASLFMDSEVRVQPSPADAVFLSAKVERPMDPYVDFAIPRVSSGFQHSFIDRSDMQLTASGALRALDLQLWKRDGWALRPMGQADWSARFVSFAWIGARLGGFLQAQEYSDTLTGELKPKYGIHERLFLRGEWGRWTVESAVYFEQAFTRRWNGAIDFSNMIAFSVDSRVRIGISHQTDNGIVDGATGRYRDIRYFDGHESRYGLFAMAEI